MKSVRKDILTIIKKEFHRFFGDKRLFFTAVIMPGLLIFVLYSLMGKWMNSSLITSEDYVSDVYTINFPNNSSNAELYALLNSFNVNYIEINEAELEAKKSDVNDDIVDAIIVFPEGFNEDITQTYTSASGLAAPNVEIYYNSADTDSLNTMSAIEAILDQYEDNISNRFDINNSENKIYNLASSKDTTAMIFSMIMPMLLMIFLYTGCISVAPDSIAGEKDRGTIATLLVTPMNRSALALGKIISISVFSILSGLSSFLGTILSIPFLLGNIDSSSIISASTYSFIDYILLFLVICSLVLVYVSVLAVISAFAKNVKEAGNMVIPFMLIIMFSGISTAINDSEFKVIDAFIPISGSAKILGSIFSFDYNIFYVILTIFVNIIISTLFTFVLTRMFNNEKIMYTN